jgi:hypothetical protein
VGGTGSGEEALVAAGRPERRVQVVTGGRNGSNRGVGLPSPPVGEGVGRGIGAVNSVGWRSRGSTVHRFLSFIPIF